jgi:hypothetical protein
MKQLVDHRLYRVITQSGTSGSARKLTFIPRLFIQRHSHEGPLSLTSVSAV